MNEWFGDIKREGRLSSSACIVETISEVGRTESQVKLATKDLGGGRDIYM